MRRRRPAIKMYKIFVTVHKELYPFLGGAQKNQYLRLRRYLREWGV